MSLRVTISRNDLCLLKDGMESIIEDFKYNGGLALAEDYIALENRLDEWLRDYDTSGKRKAAGRRKP